MIHPTAQINIDKVTIGKNVHIGPFCTIGFAPEHKGINPNNPEEYGRVIIEDNCDIRNGVNIDAGYSGTTIIGKGTMIMAQSHIGHDVVTEENVTISSGAIIGGHSVLRKNSNIGLGAVLHQYTEVGEGTIVGAGCFAKGKLDPWSKYYSGEKAKNQGLNTHLLKQMNIDPNQLEGFNH